MEGGGVLEPWFLNVAQDQKHQPHLGTREKDNLWALPTPPE